MFYPPKIHSDAIDKMINFLLEANKLSVLSTNASAEKVEIDQFVYILASDCGLLENKLHLYNTHTFRYSPIVVTYYQNNSHRDLVFRRYLKLYP